MEQSKIDISKIIVTKLSEDTAITHCDTKVWIKTIFMETWVTCWSTALIVSVFSIYVPAT